jgi:membrane protein DedA with SNARE-associated domain/membrane-associated phospholipid phosphatase
MAFFETGAFVGLILPGDTIIILAGALAGVGETSIVLTIAVVWFCAWMGDTISFFLGQRLGRGFIERHGPRFRVTPERFARVDDYFKRHGGSTIIVGRFIGIVRAMAPFVAGSSQMTYRQFVPFSILGTGLWAATFSLIGYFASRSINKAADAVGRGTLVFGISIAMIAAVVYCVRWLRDPERRERLVAAMERRPALRPLVSLGRRVQPQAAFVWKRVTPGGLGLELTTLFAVLAVSLFVLIGYAVTVSADPGPTGADQAAIDLVRDLQAGWATTLNKAITHLGSGWVVYPVGAVGAVILLARRRYAEAAVVAAGCVLIAISVPVMKEAISRPRPPDALIPLPGNAAYPSGHAAQATVYVALAVLLARELNPRLHIRAITAGGALVLVGILLAALIGLSRVYLNVHYFSDVAGGWGLGLAAFSLAGVVALIVTHLRQNGRGGRGPGQDRP